MEVNEAAAAYAAAANVPVMLNRLRPQFSDRVLLGNIDCILPNETSAQLSVYPSPWQSAALIRATFVRRL
jgi:hypothetical protein